MDSQAIRARISIGRESIGDVAFIYDFNKLKILNAKGDDYWKETVFFEVGTEIELKGHRFRIVEVQTAILSKTMDMSNPPGLPSTEIGEALDFNFEIIYYVESIDN